MPAINIMKHNKFGITPPCKSDCPNRSITCHSNCSEYIEFRNKIDEINKRKREYKEKLYG